MGYGLFYHVLSFVYLVGNIFKIKFILFSTSINICNFIYAIIDVKYKYILPVRLTLT